MLLFGGLARIYSTCRDCRELMIVLDADDTVHATCTPKPTKIEQLAANWLQGAAMGVDNQLPDHIRMNMGNTADLIERLDSQPPQLRRYAMHYARMGWPVFPLRPNAKTPASAHGFKDAITDVAEIDKFWVNHPNYNIGLATGHLFDVIDIDPPAGVPSFLQLLADKLLPEIHGIAVTASGGMHLYIEPTSRGNSAGILPGIDYRGLGGYTVAPPSTLGPRGRSWSWMTVPSPAIKKEARCD